MTQTYTRIAELVIWHLIDTDGTCLVARIGRDAFLEDCELMYSVDASLLPMNEVK